MASLLWYVVLLYVVACHAARRSLPGKQQLLSLRSSIQCTEDYYQSRRHCTFDNLVYHRGKLFAMVADGHNDTGMQHVPIGEHHLRVMDDPSKTFFHSIAMFVKPLSKVLITWYNV